MHASMRIKLVGLWLLLGAIAAVVCSLNWPQAHMGEEYLPVSVDSWYHARRILDTVADPAGFYEFDSKIHAPEGSLLAWPWGYDYAMAWLVKAATAVGIPGSPLAILIWIPVAAVFVSMALLLRIARRLELSTASSIVAGLCLAFSPLTQYLHGVGIIDHHYAEYIFVLATVGSGLAWFSQPDNARAAAITAVVLAAAPAIHNGLFVLQVPLLAGLLVLWLQDVRFPLRSVRIFSAVLLAATLAILLPSLPFRLGHFEFYTLSWFHLYVAFGTGVTALTLASLTRTRRNVAVLIAVALVLLVPLAHQIVVARAFLAGTIERLDVISEVRSISTLAQSTFGRHDLTMMYSALIWLLPLTFILCIVKGWQERASARVFFWLCCVFGLVLLATQLRLHYFGSFALYLPWLVMADEAAARWPSRRKLIVLLTCLGALLMYALPARYELTTKTALAGDPNFGDLRPILAALQKACAEEPGVVLADNDAGHYIRYYTQCSVIANNFLLTRQHEEKIRLIDHLTSLPANELPAAAPYVRYVLLRPVSVQRTEEGAQYVSYSQQNPRLLQELLLRPLDELPSAYSVIEQASIRRSTEEDSVPYMRLLKVKQVGNVSTARPSQKTADS